MRPLRVLLPVAALSALALLQSASQAAIEGSVWASLDDRNIQAASPSGAYSYTPALSDDGRYVVFESLAPLARDFDKNGVGDVFLRDLEEPALEIVSVGDEGQAGDNRSYGPSISADAALVVFESLASNLVAGDGNNAADVFLRDRAAGTTVRVSAPSDADSNGAGYRPSISGDGRFVAFCSRASNLVAGDTNGVADAFLYEVSSGTLTLVPVEGPSAGVSDGCLNTAVSHDGARVVVAASSGGSGHVYVYDAVSGSTTSLTDGADGPSGASGVAISGDGRYIVFDSEAANLVPDDTNGSRDVFVHDLERGETVRASVRSDGSQAPGASGTSGVSINRDGAFVVFGSTARELVPGDSNGREDVFRRDLAAGQTTIASVNYFGEAANDSSYSPAVNGDGSVVAFVSMAANIVSGDSNRQPDIYLRGGDFPDQAGTSSGPADTGGAAGPDVQLPVASGDDDGIPPAAIVGGAAGGLMLFLIASWFLLGRRGRA